MAAAWYFVKAKLKLLDGIVIFIDCCNGPISAPSHSTSTIDYWTWALAPAESLRVAGILVLSICAAIHYTSGRS